MERGTKSTWTSCTEPMSPCKTQTWTLPKKMITFATILVNIDPRKRQENLKEAATLHFSMEEKPEQHSLITELFKNTLHCVITGTMYNNVFCIKLSKENCKNIVKYQSEESHMGAGSCWTLKTTVEEMLPYTCRIHIYCIYIDYNWNCQRRNADASGLNWGLEWYEKIKM